MLGGDLVTVKFEEREKSLKLIGVGDNVCDVYVSHKIMYPGGQALNVAVFAAMQKAEVAYLGIFGNDMMGKHVKNVLADIGIPIEGSLTVQGDNGFALVDHIEGDRRFIGSNKGGVLRQRGFCFGEKELALISSYDVLHTSNNSYTDDWLEMLAKLPTKISYDFSGDWRNKEKLKKVCPYADYVFLSLTDKDVLTYTQIGEGLLELGASHVIMTAGDKGAYYMDRSMSLYQPAYLVKAVDTLGAGDSFASAFLAHTFTGKNIRQALKEAAKFSAECCLREGAFGYGKEIDDHQIEELRTKIIEG